MRSRSPSRRAASPRGLTLLEMVVSTAVLSILILVTAYTLLPLQRESTHIVTNTSLDDTARKILFQLRREIRQSGKGMMDDGTTPRMTSPPEGAGPSNTLTFRIRTDLGSGDANWSTNPITYRLVQDGTFKGITGTPPRYQLVREQGGQQVVIANHLTSNLSFERSAGDASVLVQIELMKPDPYWTGSTPPPPFRRTYRDRLALLNN